MPELVECLSSGARKQIMVSEPRKGLLALIVMNHELGQLITTLYLSSLKKSGTCAQLGKNLDSSGLERILEWHQT